MKRDEFDEVYNRFIDRYGLEPEDAVVKSGAACMMHGIRDFCNDVDLDVPKLVFDYIVAEGDHLVQEMNVPHYDTIRTVKCIRGVYKSIDVHISTPTDQVEVIKGIGVLSLPALLEQKLAMNRPKDQVDIELIRKRLKKKGL